MSKLKITLNAGGHYGYVEYDESNKSAEVVIDGAEEAVKAVLAYLAVPQTMDVPSEDIRDFRTVTLEPLANKENFQTCLTRLWVQTNVRVEWSMPPEIAEKL